MLISAKTSRKPLTSYGPSGVTAVIVVLPVLAGTGVGSSLASLATRVCPLNRGGEVELSQCRLKHAELCWRGPIRIVEVQIWRCGKWP